MPDITATADQFAAALAAGERAAAARLVEAYGQAWTAIRADLDALTAQITAARAAGVEVGPAWLFQQRRLEALLGTALAELERVTGIAEVEITAAQRAATAAGTRDAARLGATALGAPPTAAGPQPGPRPRVSGRGEPAAQIVPSFTRLPQEALTDLVGVLADGSPLRALLDELGPGASAAVRQALITGVALGSGPRDIARTVREALGGNLARALTIARTETLRAYRESQRRTYQANGDVLEGWTWHATLTPRTCAFCWARHGQPFPLDTPMATHPRCRCTLVPRTRSWADLGFPDVPDAPRPEIPRGTDRFDALPEADQRRILGPGKFAAYAEGRLALADLVQERDDPRWGRVGQERSLRDALGG